MKESFSKEDLKTFFTSRKFTALKDSNPALYWIPWIGLYTGMRVEEIAQLQCSDILQKDNLWVISINDDNAEETRKKLKTKNSKRLIPVHDHLIKLGLIEYRDRIEKNNKRLFPELRARGAREQYGKSISRDFGPLVRSLGIDGKKTFHSLRHTFDDFFKRLDLEDSTIFKELFGHSTDNKGLASSEYGSRFTPRECYDRLISKIDYGLEE